MGIPTFRKYTLVLMNQNQDIGGGKEAPVNKSSVFYQKVLNNLLDEMSVVECQLSNHFDKVDD